jgi:hypothetical protein
VRILFPKGLDKQALEVASISNQLLKQPPGTLGGKVKPISVVLQNLSVQSNAYVGLAPRRSEFFLRPEFSNLQLSSLPWHRLLAIHETRHIHQYDAFNKGMPLVLRSLLGEQGALVGMNAVVPGWFWEGDAVWLESVVTPQGRGRLPSFFNGYRSLWMSEKNYSYQKLRNGSLRHYVPNHYELGYLLVNYGVVRFGEDLWRHVTTDALKLKGGFYPFQKAVRRHTGFSFSAFTDSAFAYYRNQIPRNALSSESMLLTPAQKNNVKSYTFPLYTDDGTILALKKSYREIPRWIRMRPDSAEQFLRVRDIDLDDYHSLRQDELVYTSYKPHPRWGYQEYSIIKVLNTATGKTEKMSRHSRLFMPDLSPDKNQLLAVYYGTDLSCSLQIADRSEKIWRALPNDSSYIYTYPKFSADGHYIFSAVRNMVGEMSIVQKEIKGGREWVLFPFTHLPIAYLQLTSEYLFFTAPQQSADVLYRMRLQDHFVEEVGTLPNGNYQPAFHTESGKLVWNSWSADGNLLLQKKLNSFSGNTFFEPAPIKQLYNNTQNRHLGFLNEVHSLDTGSSLYKQGLHLLNIHSWRPRFFDPDYGVTVYSDNILNTCTGEYAYNYNRNESSHQLSANILYAAWYPILSAGLTQTWHRSFYQTPDSLITWNQRGINAGVILPLNLTGGRNFRQLTLRTSFHSDYIQYTGLASKLYKDDPFRYMQGSINWVQQSQKALQQIYPRWAHTFSAQIRQTVQEKKGQQLLINAGLYLPGMFRNHHLVLFASYQRRDTLEGGRFAINFPYARGYTPVNFPRLFRWSANYHFPIVYPDWGMGNLIYFLRIRSNLFYDYTLAKSLRTGRRFPLRSAGTELFFDTRIWNEIPVSFGIRFTRLMDQDLVQPGRNPNQFEFVLPLDLF